MQKLSKTRLSALRGLDRKKNRDKLRMFIAEGTKSVVELSKSRFRVKIIVGTGDWWKNNSDKLAISYSYEGIEATPDEIRKLSQLSTPSEVIGFFELPESQGNPRCKHDSLNLLLDGIRDPGNMGTIIRTADWFGIHEIFASEDTVDVYNPKVVMSTMGSLGRVEVKYCSLLSLIRESPGLPVYGTLLDGMNIYDSDLPSGGSILIMGNEGKGLCAEVKKLVSHPILIPPADAEKHPESLNVSIAAAISLSEFFRKKLS